LEYNFLTTWWIISFLSTIHWMLIASFLFGSNAVICRRWISLILPLVFVCICTKIGSVGKTHFYDPWNRIPGVSRFFFFGQRCIIMFPFFLDSTLCH
jgi:hypothetical protein